MASSNPPLAQQVYATIASGPSDDDFPGLVDIPLDDEPYPGYSALTSSTGSAISFSSSELNRTVLHRCGASSATYHRMCDEERQALRRFKVERFARDLYERLMKVKRRRDGLETEEEKGQPLKSLVTLIDGADALRCPFTRRAMQTLSTLHQHYGKRTFQHRPPIPTQRPPPLSFKSLLSHLPRILQQRQHSRLPHILQQTQHSLLAPKKRDLPPKHPPTQPLHLLPLPHLPFRRSPLPHDLSTPRTRPLLSPLQALQPIKRQPLLHQTRLPHDFR